MCKIDDAINDSYLWLPGVFPGGPFFNHSITQWYPNGYQVQGTGAIAKCSEPFVQWDIRGEPVEVFEPYMIIFGGIGILTGLLGFLYITKSNLVYKDMYRLTYFWFIFMNTSGVLVHCIFVPPTGGPPTPGWPPKTMSDWLAVLDCYFSTNTSLSFTFAALGDWHVLKWSRLSTKVIVIGSYMFTAYGYYMGLTNAWPNIWHILYVDVTQYSSLFFLVSSVIWLAVQSCKRRKLLVVPFGLMIVSELIGLKGLQYYQSDYFRNQLCTRMGNMYGSESFWYTCSDLSLILLLLSYITSHQPKDMGISEEAADEAGSDSRRHYVALEEDQTTVQYSVRV